MSSDRTEETTTAASGVGRRSVLLGALGIPVAAALAACGGGGAGNGNQAGGNGGAPTTTTPGGGGTATTTPGGGGGTTTTTTATGGRTGSATATKVVQPPITVRGQEANYHGEQSVIGESSATVDLYDFYFEPTVLVGSPGQELTVNLLNEGEVPHTFTIEEQGVDVVLEPGQRGQAKVRFPESGKQGVVCRFHIPQGMLGLLATKS